MNKIFLYILCTSLLFGCDNFKSKEEKVFIENSDKPLARVFNKHLYYEDIKGIIGKHTSKEDSAAIVKNYINSWIRKQLILSRAEAQIDEAEEGFAKKVEDCKNTMLTYEYEKNYLSQKLDTNFSEKDLRSYYDSHLESFALKQNIFKGVFIKIPKVAPNIEKVKTLVANAKPKDMHELNSYCVRFADYYSLEDSVWNNFDEILRNSGLNSINDKSDFLEKTKFSVITENDYIYLIRIKDFKISKEISPFDFAQKQIKEILLNKRRIDLINELKQNIYKEAKQNNEFEIYQ